ncbi:HAMP domain-containing sensor histidine kinase [uncultured Clostridium sp.]|uniref:sensor histidine kinase n=1 Tax=uncultured Clostridium sp. TaxID=59620 RepID=UPI0025EEDA1B|nr:HAMP domain-containing sensor histidine kinase [uncultured Clostridium sp.]MDU4884824.1 HAMP domain-containing sensor histidine kinase [Clostridium celatum]MDU7078051.1 HAMP domain-containing sensor histidine kinase [Clostridium celatum]
MSIFIVRIFWVYDDKEYINSSVIFVRQVNALISVTAIASCLILYKKTKDSIVFTLLLVYVGLSIASITGQLDYYTFLDNEFRVSNYLSITTSFLRAILLFTAVRPNSKLHKLLNRYKAQSFIFVVIYSIISWEIEKRKFIGGIFSSEAIFVSYNLLISTVYVIVALKLLLIGIKEAKILLGTFSISLFLIAIKVFYIIYGVTYNSINMKLTSSLLTYLSFIIVIIGSIIELYLLYKEADYLNRELRKFYNLANNNKHSYIFICDKNYNVSFMNEKIREDYGYKMDNEEFKEQLLKINLPEEIKEIISKELVDKSNWRGILKTLKKDSIVDCSIQLLKSEEEESQILVSYIDMSETIKLQSEIEAHKINDVKRSEFISTLSHELKTPLNIFYSIIQLLDKTEAIGIKEFKEAYDKYSASLKLNSKRMLRLINNIVDSTRIDTGDLNAEFGNYEVVSIVEDIVMSIVPFAQSKNINVEFDTNIEEHFIKCDPVMIEKIVLNLVSNSIKYTEGEGIIKVDLMLKDDILEMQFKDTGIGIPSELKDKIFHRFSRVDSSLKRANEGSGIGLNIVKSMIEVHNGSISVDSILNEGSTFKVKLPNVLIEDSPMIIYEFNKANTELELSDIYN